MTRVVAGDDPVEERGIGRVAVDAARGRAARASDVGVARDRGDAMAAVEEGVADGTAGSAGGADHEDVHGVLRSSGCGCSEEHDTDSGTARAG